jgi:hypothetical protein
MPPLCPRCLLNEAHDTCPVAWPCLYCYVSMHDYCDPIRYCCSCGCGLKGTP